jgi:hypothetical protein
MNIGGKTNMIGINLTTLNRNDYNSVTNESEDAASTNNLKIA